MNNTTSRYFRPLLHITVPYWLNDPCAPCYDLNTGLYHVLYQANPYGTAWGNMSWGHLTSEDFLHWTFMPKQPALSPDQKYDKEGVFTGGMAPVGRDKKLYAFYSSITALPFDWRTIPYPRNVAGLAVAVSEDGGHTWVKSANNPILPGEPSDLAVSGWRDPYIGRWDKLDNLRGSTETFYGLVSGGVHGKGPTSFLYAIKPDRMEEWKYLGRLIDIPLRWNPSTKWGGTFGVNWECVNFMTLTSQHTAQSGLNISRDFLILGAEADQERPGVKNYKLPAGLPARTVRTQMWMQGDLVRAASGEISLKYKYSGLFDHGPYYAANTFIDDKTSRRIVHGWIPEEDSSLVYAERRGWNGALALPREAFIQTIRNVSKALRSQLEDITSIEFDQALYRKSGVSDVHTLGIRPIREFLSLHENFTTATDIDMEPLGMSSKTSEYLIDVHHPTWEIEATIRVHASLKDVGFILKHSDDLSVCTVLKFDLEEETITLDRSKSIADPELRSHVNTCPDAGPFTLFTTRNPQSGIETLEKLHVRIISDGDFLEIFVNDRFAIATVVYTGNYETCGKISLFAHGAKIEEDRAVVEWLTVYDGLNKGESLISGWEYAKRKQMSVVDKSML